MLKNKYICRIALLLLIAWMVLPVSVHAATGIDTGRNVTLALDYRSGGTPVSGICFRMYRVADVDAYAAYTLTGDFKDYPVDLNGKTGEEWKVLAETLAAYVQRDQLVPVDTGETGSDGKLSLPAGGKTLTPGLYLLTAAPVASGEDTYVTEPFLVSLPNLDQDTDTWVYDVSAEPKCTVEHREKPGETVDRKVLKVWKDGRHPKGRPESVTVELLKDGQLYDTVVLKEENHWQHLWEDLPKYEEGVLIDWKVTEQKVKGYKVTVSMDGTDFVVTNTSSGHGGHGGGGSEEPAQPTSTPTPPPAEQVRLPQTGMLWWPVPLLVAAGLLSLVIWLILSRRKKDG